MDGNLDLKWMGRSKHVIAPIVLRRLPDDEWEVFIEAWHDSAPFKNAFCTLSPHVCLQLERKNICAMIWSHTQITLPRFVSTSGTTVVWEPYSVVAGVLHLGDCPNEGHCRTVFFHSGTQLIADDFALPHVIPYHEQRNFDATLWLVPKQQRGQLWIRPLPSKAPVILEAIADSLATWWLKKQCPGIFYRRFSHRCGLAVHDTTRT